MSCNVIVWDLEAVRDLRGYAAADETSAATDDEVRGAIGDKFPKHIYHSIVCIGAVVAYRSNGAWRWTLLARRMSVREAKSN
jgi:hypothetical protein